MSSVSLSNLNYVYLFQYGCQRPTCSTLTLLWLAVHNSLVVMATHWGMKGLIFGIFWWGGNLKWLMGKIDMDDHIALAWYGMTWRGQTQRSTVYSENLLSRSQIIHKSYATLLSCAKSIFSIIQYLWEGCH